MEDRGKEKERGRKVTRTQGERGKEGRKRKKHLHYL